MFHCTKLEINWDSWLPSGSQSLCNDRNGEYDVISGTRGKKQFIQLHFVIISSGLIKLLYCFVLWSCESHKEGVVKRKLSGSANEHV